MLDNEKVLTEASGWAELLRSFGTQRAAGVRYGPRGISGLRAKGCYTETRIDQQSYTENICTLSATRKGDNLMKNHFSPMAVALVSIALFVSGCNPTEDTSIPDLDKLQGTWVGKELSQEGEVKIIFSGNSIDFKGAHPQEWYKGNAVLNQELSPKQADFTISECAVPDYVGKVSKAIYRLEGSTLTLAGSEPGDETRPSSFDPSGGGRVFQLTLQPSNE